jgi:hypothetical protein
MNPLNSKRRRELINFDRIRSVPEFEQWCEFCIVELFMETFAGTYYSGDSAAPEFVHQAGKIAYQLGAFKIARMCNRDPVNGSGDGIDILLKCMEWCHDPKTDYASLPSVRYLMVHLLAERQNKPEQSKKIQIKPEWSNRELRFNGELCCKYARLAECQHSILDAFQNQKWPEELTFQDIQSAYPDADLHESRILQTVKDLNKKLTQSPIDFKIRNKSVVWYRKDC